MRSLLYGALGITVGVFITVALYIQVPQATMAKSSIREFTREPVEEVIASPTIPTNPASKLSVNYRLDNQRLEQYKTDNIITYSRVNPMSYYTHISEPEPTEPTTPNNPKNDDIKEIEEVIENNAIDEFDWRDYETSYTLPKGYLIGYNVETQKLNIIDVKEFINEYKISGSLPVKEKHYGISSRFGMRNNPFDKVTPEFHEGLDISSYYIYLTDVYSILDGKIVEMDYIEKDYGNYIVIEHNNGVKSLYSHLDTFNQNLQVGDTVNSGDFIGTVGKTGRVTGAHVHFELIKGSIRFNPECIFEFINKEEIVI